MLAFIFFPNKAETCTMSMTEFVKNFERINNISWPCSIHEDLMMKIKRCEGKATSVSGCVIQLLYFVCEHANLIEPEKGNEKIFPRAGKWSLNKICWDLQAKIQKLKDEHIYDDMHQPFTKEEKLLTDVKYDDVDPTDEDSINEVEKSHNIQTKDEEIKDLKEQLNRSEKEKASLLAENKQLKEEIQNLKNEKYVEEESEYEEHESESEEQDSKVNEEGNEEAEGEDQDEKSGYETLKRYKIKLRSKKVEEMSTIIKDLDEAEKSEQDSDEESSDTDDDGEEDEEFEDESDDEEETSDDEDDEEELAVYKPEYDSDGCTIEEDYGNEVMTEESSSSSSSSSSDEIEEEDDDDDDDPDLF